MSIKIESRVTFQDLYYTRDFRNRFIESLSDSISQAVICSPFFSDKLPDPFKDIQGFCNFLSARGTEPECIQIITRPPGSDNGMSFETAKLLAGQGIDLLFRPKPCLHAKVYHFEYARGYFRTFVGSANFTLGGFERNHELVTEMEGVGANGPCHRELARLAQQGALSYNQWAAKGQPKGEEAEI
jgi:hypothetical protein